MRLEALHCIDDKKRNYIFIRLWLTTWDESFIALPASLDLQGGYDACSPGLGAPSKVPHGLWNGNAPFSKWEWPCLLQDVTSGLYLDTQSAGQCTKAQEAFQHSPEDVYLLEEKVIIVRSRIRTGSIEVKGREDTTKPTWQPNHEIIITPLFLSTLSLTHLWSQL